MHANGSQSLWARVIERVPDLLAVALRRLPSHSGDRLNFLADIVGGVVFIGIAKARVLPPQHVLPALALYFVFVLVCVAGALLMRGLRRQGRV